MTRPMSARQMLPFVPQPFPGEMLSSWLRRIAAEYGVSLERLAQHFGLSVWRPVHIDHASTRDDIDRTATALSVAPAEIRAMVHRPLKTAVAHLREKYRPVQVCTRCRADHVSKTNQPVAIKAWFEYWRIECQQCCLPFSAPGGPNLNWSNPAREEPEWFSQILPLARRGAAHLASFVRRPHRSWPSPVKILRLLSMRLYPFAQITPAPAWTPRQCIAELFLPDRSERLPEYPLLPELWTEQRPVRLVTARAILFAAMANFLAEPKEAYARLVGTLDWSRYRAVEQWLGNQPDRPARMLEESREDGQSISSVYQLQQM